MNLRDRFELGVDHGHRGIRSWQISTGKERGVGGCGEWGVGSKEWGIRMGNVEWGIWNGE